MNKTTDKRRSEEARKYLEKLEDGLKARWVDLANERFSQNTKGQGFEIAALKFFKEYVGNSLEFHNRVALLDRKLRLRELLPGTKNEWDVVAVLPTAIPRLALRVENLVHVPLDACFFVAEVKSKLTKTALKKDLDKISLLRDLASPNRFGVADFLPPYQEKDLLRILLYHKGEIASSSLAEIIRARIDAWDIILLLDTDTLFVNKKIQTARELAPGPDSVARTTEFPLIQLLNFMAFALPTPGKVLTSGAWNNLIRVAQGFEPD